LLYKILGAASF